MVYEAKTKPTNASVTDFIDTVADERKRADALLLLDLFERITGDPAYMWGPSIIGFGSYHYEYDSGHKGDAPRAGFSPRKANIVLYLTNSSDDPALQAQITELHAKLGKHKLSKACLYINKLSDIDVDVLGELVRVNGIKMDAKYPR